MRSSERSTAMSFFHVDTLRYQDSMTTKSKSKFIQIHTHVFFLFIIIAFTITPTKSQISWPQIDTDMNGWTVSLNGLGNIVAIGQTSYDGPSGTDSGRVQVYQNINGVLTQLGSDIDGGASNDYSGWSTALNDAGNILAITAPNHNGASGQVRVFEYASSQWTRIGQDLDGNSVQQQCGQGDAGVSMNANGTVIVFGCRYFDNAMIDPGVAYVYAYDESLDLWVQRGSDIVGTEEKTYLGWSVAMNSVGDIVAAGATEINNGDRAGYVRLFQYDAAISNDWSQMGPDIDGATAYDYSGWTVALNAAGDIVAIGAREFDGVGTSSGHTRVFQYDSSTNTFLQLGSDIEGAAASDFSGESIALSDDGDIIAIGAAYNDGGAANGGSVRIYQYDESISDWVSIGDKYGVVADGLFGNSVALSSNGQILAAGAQGEDVARVYEMTTLNPTVNPTLSPTANPSQHPTTKPSTNPTVNPSQYPTTKPTTNPTSNPSHSPTESTTDPTENPTVEPTSSPSDNPTLNPIAPTVIPSTNPTVRPTADPTQSPSCVEIDAQLTECTETLAINLDCNQDQQILLGIIGFLGVFILILFVILCSCHRRKSGYVRIMRQLSQNQINPAGNELMKA